jgi:ribonuclease-3
MSTESDKKVLLVYNPNNHLVTIQMIKEILKVGGLDYQPHDLSIFQKGLTHQSYVVITNPTFEYEYLDNCVELQPNSNERLEYLGDSIIGSIVSSYLFHRYPNQDEGFLTKLKTKLVRTDMLAEYCAYVGLNRHLLISKHVEDVCEGRTNERILEDTFEAFVGSLFEDIYQDDLDRYGLAMQVCSKFIVHLMEDTTDFRPLISINDNYKELLLQFYHKYWVGIHPTYHEMSVDGPPNKRSYTMGVNHPLTNQLIGQGTSRKKSMAEQTASKQALEYFEHHPQQVSEEKRIGTVAYKEQQANKLI